MAFNIHGNYIEYSAAEKKARRTHVNCFCKDCRSGDAKFLDLSDETVVAIEDVMDNGTYGEFGE